jgi:hypothetical protein
VGHQPMTTDKDEVHWSTLGPYDTGYPRFSAGTNGH